MLSGIPLLALILIVLLFIILACTVWKAHPFLVLIISAIALGLGSGMGAKTMVDHLLNGSGAVFAAIGFVIALGTLLGEVLEKTGAITSIARSILRYGGNKKVLPSMSVLGAFTGIPVFCDSGFVILSNLGKSLAQQTGVSFSAISIALATGLYTTHVLIPPTPGPLAVVGNFNMTDQLGWVILIGLIVSIPAVITGWWFARKCHQADPHTGEWQIESSDNQPGPGFYRSLIPLLLPMLLIAFGSVIPLINAGPAVTGILLFFCNPTIALLTGVLTGFFLLGLQRKKEWNGWIQHSLVQAGPIILITAAGGALGAILKATPLAGDFARMVKEQELTSFILFPIAYLLAAGLKTAQGSSTASLIITSSILAPLLPGLAIDHAVEKTLLLLTVGAGAMTVSHANDSYFWVINQYSQIPVGKMYKYFTTASFFMGLVVLATCLLFLFIFKFFMAGAL